MRLGARARGAHQTEKAELAGACVGRYKVVLVHIASTAKRKTGIEPDSLALQTVERSEDDFSVQGLDDGGMGRSVPLPLCAHAPPWSADLPRGSEPP